MSFSRMRSAAGTDGRADRAAALSCSMLISGEPGMEGPVFGGVASRKRCTADSCASLRTPCRSAPLKPSVSRAISARSTSAARGSCKGEGFWWLGSRICCGAGESRRSLLAEKPLRLRRRNHREMHGLAVSCCCCLRPLQLLYTYWKS